jgi:xylulokinase
MADELGLRSQTRLVAGSHDQCCNALGAGGIHGGQAICGIGTYECIAPIFEGVPNKQQMLSAGLNIEHHVLRNRYVAFIYNQAGMLTDWFCHTYGSDFGELEAQMPDAPTRLITLPYFEPSGAPDLVADAAGAVLGLRSTTTRGELYRSLLEGISFFFVESLQRLEAMGARPDHMVATGGGARSHRLLQLQADIFGIPITRLGTPEAGAAGAAMLAGLATGLLVSPEEACEAFVSYGDTSEPNDAMHAAYMERYEAYRKALPECLELLRQMRR